MFLGVCERFVNIGSKAAERVTMYLDTVLEAVKLEREETLAWMPKKQQQITNASSRATHLPAGIGNLATSLADYPPKVSIVSQLNSRIWAPTMR